MNFNISGNWELAVNRRHHIRNIAGNVFTVKLNVTPQIMFSSNTLY